MSDNNERELLKQRRRALIKAAGAAPVVMTLPYGGNVAAASLTCIQKADQNLPAPANVTSSATTDTWVRVKVPQHKYKNSGNDYFGYKYLVNGADHYYVFSGGTWRDLGTSLASTGYTDKGITGSYYYLLVDLNSDGSFGVYPADSNIANPVPGASCWNSVNPNNRNTFEGNILIS